MTRQEAIEQLQAKLETVIDGWLNNIAEPMEVECQRMGYIGDSLPRLMAKSAMATWEASADVQQYLKDDGQIDIDL